MANYVKINDVKISGLLFMGVASCILELQQVRRLKGPKPVCSDEGSELPDDWLLKY